MKNCRSHWFNVNFASHLIIFIIVVIFVLFAFRKEMVDEEVTLKNPSEAVEEVETLAEEFYNKPLILEEGIISHALGLE